MSFAAERYVAKMRDLLLQHGATERNKDHETWDLHQRADVAENIMKSDYKNNHKDLNPWSGNEMDF